MAIDDWMIMPNVWVTSIIRLLFISHCRELWMMNCRPACWCANWLAVTLSVTYILLYIPKSWTLKFVSKMGRSLSDYKNNRRRGTSGYLLYTNDAELGTYLNVIDRSCGFTYQNATIYFNHISWYHTISHKTKKFYWKLL